MLLPIPVRLSGASAYLSPRGGVALSHPLELVPPLWPRVGPQALDRGEPLLPRRHPRSRAPQKLDNVIHSAHSAGAQRTRGTVPERSAVLPIRCFAAQDHLRPYVYCVPFYEHGEIEEDGEELTYRTWEETEAGVL